MWACHLSRTRVGDKRKFAMLLILKGKRRKSFKENLGCYADTWLMGTHFLSAEGEWKEHPENSPGSNSSFWKRDTSKHSQIWVHRGPAGMFTYNAESWVPAQRFWIYCSRVKQWICILNLRANWDRDTALKQGYDNSSWEKNSKKMPVMAHLVKKKNQ